MIDCHCHLYDEKMLPDIENIIKNAGTAGIFNFICMSTDLESINECLKLKDKYENIYVGAGFYPCDVYKLEDVDVYNSYIKLLKENRDKIIVIGEIGLDYYWEKEENNRELQRKWFIKQIEIANELDLPICIHTRDAIQDTYDILKNHPLKRGFYLHAYNASVEMTREFIKLGAYFSIGGVVTYKNANNLVEAVKEIPLDRLFLETDSPYLPPVPYRGQMNQPAYMIETAKKVAEIKGISLDTLDKLTMENFKHFFHVEKL